MIDLNKIVTLQELLNFCKKYDDYGEKQYRENFLEGKSFFDEFVHVLYDVKVYKNENDILTDSETDFDREIEELFNDYDTVE